MKELRKPFEKVLVRKPTASRKESREVDIVTKGFRVFREDMLPMHKPAARRWRFRLRHDSLPGRFLFEFVVVVAGVLVALALNAWFQERLDAKTEAGYLALLSRDLERTISDLTTFTAFEALQIDDAALAQRSIARLPPAGDTAKLSEAMARLVTRQTLVLKNSTYLDLVNTGRLSLIRDAALRDAIVDFYQVTSQRFEVINRNNSYFIDQVYNTNVIMSGLIQARPASNHPQIAPDVAAIAEKLGPEFTIAPDRLWSFPAGASEWSMVRSNLMGRMIVSTTALRTGGERLEAARKLAAAIALARRA